MVESNLEEIFQSFSMQGIDTIYWVDEKSIPPSQCQSIITGFEKDLSVFEFGKVGDGEGDVREDLSIRNVSRIYLSPHNGIAAMIAGTGIAMNNSSWKFDVTHANQSEYLRYESGGKYSTHKDTQFNPQEKEFCRKVSVLAFLNDDFEGGKFYISAGPKKIYPPQTAGTVIAFPSFLSHGVEPVLQGVRRTIITWLVGPWFK